MSAKDSLVNKKLDGKMHKKKVLLGSMLVLISLITTGCTTLTNGNGGTTYEAHPTNVRYTIEYGFYANVNPEVDHPRWSQARERRIGSEQGSGLQSLFAARKQETVMYNGYGEHVAHLYDGLDLRKNF